MTATGPRARQTTTVRALILDLLDNRDRSLDDVADQHLVPGFTQTVNGHQLTRREFLDGIATLRDATRSIDVTVLDELRTNNRYAERHILTLVDTAGGRSTREVYVFAVVAPDGRFVAIEEASIDGKALASSESRL